MSQEPSADIVRLEAAQAAIRNAFLGWQCRLRQRAMRNSEGRPGSGMRPNLILGEARKGTVNLFI